MATSGLDDFYDGKDQSEWNLETFRRKFIDVVGRLQENYTLYHAMRRQYENVSKENVEILEKCYQQESNNQVLQQREENTEREVKEWRLKCRTSEMEYSLAQKDIDDIKEVNAFMMEELRLNLREIASLQKHQERAETDEGRASSNRSSNILEKEQVAASHGSCNRIDKELTTSSRSRNRIEEEQVTTSSGIPSKSEIEQVSTSSGSRNKLDQEDCSKRSSGTAPSIQPSEHADKSTDVPECVAYGSPIVSSELQTEIDDMRKGVRMIKEVAKQRKQFMMSLKSSHENTNCKWAAFDIVLDGGTQTVENFVVNKNVRKIEKCAQPAASNQCPSRRDTNISPSEQSTTRNQTADKGVLSKDTTRGAKLRNQYGTKGAENEDQSPTSSGSGGRINVTELLADPRTTANRNPIRTAKNITPPEVASDKRKLTCNQSGRSRCVTPSESASRTRFPPIPERTSLISKFNSDPSADSSTNDISNDFIAGSAMRTSTEGKKEGDSGDAWFNKIGKSTRTLAAVVSSSTSKLPKINDHSSSSLGKSRSSGTSLLGKSRSSGTFSSAKIEGTKRFRSTKLALSDNDGSPNATSGILYDITLDS